MITTGVYIGRDLEVVATDSYLITYRRNNKLDFLESRLFRMSNGGYDCIGICRTSPTETEQRKPPKVWQWAFIFRDKVQATDPEMERCIHSSVKIVETENQITVDFSDDAVYQAALDEPFTMQSLTPTLPVASENNIGECLRLWNMGLNEEIFDIDGVPTFIGITVNTEKHMYIFEMTPGSIYCRAARFVATNQGMVFNQNFRQGFEAYMLADNREAREPLVIDDTLFQSDVCSWNGKSVYWSLAQYNEEQIVLNGCQGEQYFYDKPHRES